MGRRTHVLTAALALMMLLGANSLAGDTSAQDLVGLWLTEDADAHIRIDTCNDGLCGRIVWMSQALNDGGAELRDRKNPDAARRVLPVQGMTILRIADTPDANGVLRGGKVYDPKSGRTYRCTLRSDGEDALKIRGFLGISLLGKTTRWVRLADNTDLLNGSMLSDGR